MIDEKALAAFTASYVATALWSSALDEFDASDLSEDATEAMQADCRAFYAACHDLIHCEGAPLANDFEGPISQREAAMAGHDFWLTRCGHGAGFWDGDWPEPAAAKLTQAAEGFGNVDLYEGDNGKIEIC